MANSIAYGFVGMVDLFSRRIAEIGIERVEEAMLASIAEYRREGIALMSLFSTRVTTPKIRYIQPAGGTLQPLDEWGNPLPIQGGASYDVGFPIQGGGTAWGDNRVTRAKMRVEEANAFALQVESQDRDWIARHALAALFTNTTNGWTFVDKEFGSIAVQGLANGDAVTYLTRGGTLATDDHYGGQAAAIADATNPYPTMAAELNEHPSNTGRNIAFIPSGLVATTKALATFRPADDPNVTPGANTAQFVGAPYQGLGDTFLGYEESGGVYIVEWRRMPAGYILMVNDGADPVLGMREHPETELQGLFPEFHDVDGNRHVYRFIRYAGFGVRNRVGAVVWEVSDATYDIPTGYSAPLAV